MSWIEALILGLLQGLTEFLPVSSSGHLELGKYLFGHEGEKNMIFTVVVHGATVLSTIVVFRKDIADLIKALFSFKYNNETAYAFKLLLSMIPVVIIGLLFKDELEALFTGNLVLVGSMLLLTASLLAFTYYAKNRNKSVGYISAVVIGLAQALAVLPGVSRSGATISAALLLGINKEKAAKFSFLMVLLPIIGANAKSIIDGELSNSSGADILPLTVGFFAAFISGLLACTWMLKIVKRGKLIWFAVYCLIIGATAVSFGLLS